jgi:hypothetical protein
MNHLLVVAAVVLFILAAIFFFFVEDITLKTDFGIVAAGLACLAASFLPLAGWAGRRP